MSEPLQEFIARHENIFVLTGAGISTASGIPDYRDCDGNWKHQKPMQYREFVETHAARQRYWTRSWFGWQRFSRARPNAAHYALARLQSLGRLSAIVTQNVDGLQQRAGSRDVIELHGGLDRVNCLSCKAAQERVYLQQAMAEQNRWLRDLAGEIAPDGDAYLEQADESRLRIPGCPACGGILKPDVVFFGESVPRERVQRCRDALAASDAMLVVGSSLMVYSGFRFVREACQLGIPVAAVNRGRTRADDLLLHKYDEDCALALERALQAIDPAFAVSA